ncbi:MAG: universal stress protein [Anaerolineales bacterium]|jgi:nucleotide-binding universal stress UspA family protein
MFRRILVTLDGSAMAEQALPVAATHAKNFQSNLYLLRVINPLIKSYRTGMATISAIERAEEQLRVMAEDYLEGIATNLRAEGMEVNISTRIGVPYKEIISFSDQNNIDLIVMCTRGESGFTRWMLGSNTDYVIRGTRVPVLAVPAIDLPTKND